VFVLFDSTFDGLLSAAAWCFRNRLNPVALLSEFDQQPLLDSITIPCEPNIRSLFRRHLAQTIGAAAGEEVLDICFRAFLSETENIASSIYRYMALALETRSDPSGRLCDPPIYAVVSAAKRASMQSHMYLGLIRFKAVSHDWTVADFSPDCHVLPLIMPHFCDRLPDQNFAIRDLRRNLAAVHLSDGRTSLHVLADSNPLEPNASIGTVLPAADTGEDGFPAMWQLYLQRLSIPERRNPSLQMGNMPKKYWKYMTEFQS
jgi:probable DNA metabolism protein